MLPLRLARLLYRLTSGRAQRLQQAQSSVSILLGFHHHWPPASSQVAVGPLPSHLWGFASCLQSPMLGVCICVCVCVSPVSGPSPVIQARPPAMLSHDLIRRRGEAGSHHLRALPGSCHLSPACLDPVSGGETGWETRQPPTEVTLLHHTPRHTRSWPRAGCWEDSKYQAPSPLKTGPKPTRLTTKHSNSVRSQTTTPFDR